MFQSPEAPYTVEFPKAPTEDRLGVGAKGVYETAISDLTFYTYAKESAVDIKNAKAAEKALREFVKDSFAGPGNPIQDEKFYLLDGKYPTLDFRQTSDDGTSFAHTRGRFVVIKKQLLAFMAVTGFRPKADDPAFDKFFASIKITQ
ncbi:MAG: hypothetical protein QM811_04410 [Pirellulales bacterium]